ncbi:ATP-binding protein [Gloeobacter violaceus]|uniref:ATP-binding protein n=1 Tax=Gloeobacter violaceus TaxID=33072 RepID=UPI0013E89F4C|nr:ATP-binding protein [Gloeobacter violaceus]
MLSSAELEACFSRSPWKFVAAVPIFCNGTLAGNLWICDEQERLLSAAQSALLEHAAGLVGERLEAEERLDEIHQRNLMYEKYIEMAPDQIGLLDSELRTLTVNAALSRFSGMPKEWILGKSLWEMGIPESILAQMADWEQLIRRVFETGEPGTTSFAYSVGDASCKLYCYSLAVPQFNCRGEVVAVLNITYDRAALEMPFNPEDWAGMGEQLMREVAAHRVTQEELARLNAELEERVRERTVRYKLLNQKLRAEIGERQRIEVELQAAQARAEAAARAKSDFLAAASHELRTPMHGIISMTDLLLESDLGAEQRELAAIIGYCGETMLSLINNILDISKIEAGRMELDVVPFELPRLIDSVVAMFAEQLRSKDLRLQVLIDPEVPAQLEGDPVRLAQVLTNLVGNSLKFTPRGQIAIRVHPAAQGGDDLRLRFEVVDTGIGMAPETTGRLFQSFFQADTSTTRKYGGTGLGLAISRQLVELMGGQIGVESRLEQGSTFWFVLPLKVSAPVEPPPPSAPMTVRLPQYGPILIVEDNAVNQKVLLRHLERLGCGAEVAETGAEALTVLASRSFALVLMDCQMPVMDGFQATAEIRRREDSARRTPIVGITANASAGVYDLCLAAGMDDCLIKPVRRDQLTAAIERWALPVVGTEWATG